jgi:hypothetical protein
MDLPLLMMMLLLGVGAGVLWESVGVGKASMA